MTLPSYEKLAQVNHSINFYCIDSLHSLRTGSKLTRQENSCKHHNYGHIIMPEKDNKILKNNQDKQIFKNSIHNFHSGAKCLKKICADLKNRAAEKINYDKMKYCQ